MSFWSELFSKKEKAESKSINKMESIKIPETKDEKALSGIDYVQFEKTPGKSITLLNNDSNWNRFVQYESDNEEEITVRFKREEFESFVLNAAYKNRVIQSKNLSNCAGYELNIAVNETITTYSRWANQNEPVIYIKAMILNKNLPPGRHCCVYDYAYLVRSPFAGYLESGTFYQERANNGGRLYKIYTPKRTKEVWPRMPTDFIHDNLDMLPRVQMNFNEYLYDEHFSDSFPFWDWEAEGKMPCLRYEWRTQNFTNVTKGQHVCSIIKNPYGHNRKEYKIYSPVSGIIVLSINAKKTEYSYHDEMNIPDLFTVYKDRNSLMEWEYLLGFDEVKEEDSFEGSLSLTWDKVAGRELPPKEDEFITEGYKGFEMSADDGRYIIVSLQVKSNVPYIVFSVNSKMIRLSNGDYVDMLFENPEGETTVLSFPITRNSISDDFADVYDISYYCELSQTDIDCMRVNNCVSWRIRFSKQPLMTVTGKNESSWCPKEYAGDVFKAYADKYMEQIEELSDEYAIEFSSNSSQQSATMTDETCYVYLMYDAANGYYKIGISNQPEYRERTLQSEKPTIEKICAKSYPNRTIASAIESALHKAYESKRLRGEWFVLEPNDVTAIIATLS